MFFFVRFLFHGTSSSKVDDKVIFPLDNLDMGDYLGGRKLGPHLYGLYGVVCHMGGQHSLLCIVHVNRLSV